MRARESIRIPYEKWVTHAPQHRRSLTQNPNWWVSVAKLVKAGSTVDAAMDQIERRTIAARGRHE